MTREERRTVGQLVRTMRRLLDELRRRNSVEWTDVRTAQQELTLVEILLGGGDDEAEDVDG